LFAVQGKYREKNRPSLSKASARNLLTYFKPGAG
jgi:hypothetical protein